MVGVLVLTVIGAVGIGIYDAAQSDATPGPGADPGERASRRERCPKLRPGSAAAADRADADRGSELQDRPVSSQAVADAALNTPIQEQAATDMVGDVWSASGTITGLDTAGMT